MAHISSICSLEGNESVATEEVCTPQRVQPACGRDFENMTFIVACVAVQSSITDSNGQTRVGLALWLCITTLGSRSRFILTIVLCSGFRHYPASLLQERENVAHSWFESVINFKRIK